MEFRRLAYNKKRRYVLQAVKLNESNKYFVQKQSFFFS